MPRRRPDSSTFAPSRLTYPAVSTPFSQSTTIKEDVGEGLCSPHVARTAAVREGGLIEPSLRGCGIKSALFNVGGTLLQRCQGPLPRPSFAGSGSRMSLAILAAWILSAANAVSDAKLHVNRWALIELHIYPIRIVLGALRFLPPGLRSKPTRK